MQLDRTMHHPFRAVRPREAPMSLAARAPLGLFGERDSRPPVADPVAEVAILTGKRAAIPVRPGRCVLFGTGPVT